ncbi:hypothetical protein HRI_003004600 [Hibiscus trionum]|uniref:Retrotransposon gag domain-containing protein n=1 Tax=Hibiscus trionum TaxID=183268 RepID=A0A9W7IFG8_HIBTR|nr:hypothetical protein HRI_003004600 [Hibiscus trionum]
MVNNTEFIRTLQELSVRHDQSLAAIESQLTKQEQWNTTTNATLQEMSLLLQNLSAQLGVAATQSASGDFTANSSAPRPKPKDKHDTDAVFPFPPKPVQVELPLFTGEDPEEWLASAHDFFKFYGTEDHHRVTMASFRMTGTARKWFRWMQRQRQLAGWAHLVDAIRKRFLVMEIESPAGQLSKLLQSSTVAEYQSRFEDLALRTSNLPEEFLLDCFTSGLRADIKNEVLAHRSTSMIEVQALARFHEARLHDRRPVTRTFTSKLPPLLPTPPSTTMDPRVQPGRPPPVETPAVSPTAVRRISSVEARERRLKGLCYYCDDCYSPGHKCKTPQLFMLDDDGCLDDTADPQIITQPTPDTTPTTSDLVSDHSTVSFNALAGYHNPTTLRVEGTILGKPVRILIDGGSTHNFIQSRVAKHLALPITRTLNFTILVGNGQRLNNEGCARDVPVIVQNTKLQTDFYILPIEGADVVLGVAWMATLGPITMDFSKLTFEFMHDNTRHCWQGDSELGPQQIHLQSLRRLTDT